MVNKRFLFGILVLALVFGMMVVGCEETTPDPLNGTWVSSDGSKLILNNGSFEYQESGTPFVKGTYSTNGNNMTITVTHCYGSYFDSNGHNLHFNLDSKWYTKAEMATALEESESSFDSFFVSQTGTYSVDGNTLIMTMSSLGTQTYTKQ